MLAAAPPLEPDAPKARGWARDELADPVYAAAEPGLVERAWAWLLERLGDVTVVGGPGGTVGLVVLVIAAVLVVMLAVRVIGPLRPAASGPAGGLFTDTTRSADEHRRAAAEHATAGAWDLAVRERFRAVVRGLEERAVLDPRPGRTADEAAVDAAVALPGLADPLAAGARAFDDVTYGGRAGTEAMHEKLVALDGDVTATRLSPATR